MTELRCCKCLTNRPIEEFAKQAANTGRGGRASVCKHCMAAINKVWRDRNPDYHKNRYRSRKEHWKFYYLLKRYGVSRERYEVLLRELGGRCPICGTDKPGGSGTWHVDHNHETGQVRGLLCNDCNIGLGAMKDSPDVMRRAILYLEERDDCHRTQSDVGMGNPKSNGDD